MQLDFVTRKLAPAAGNEFVLSDGEPDRMGDIVDPGGWQISNFSPIALLNHSRDAIIGRWNRVRVADKQLRGSLALAEAGTSPVVDMVRALFDQGLLDTVSVGFRPIEHEPLDPQDPFGPRRFKKAELLEASLVSVPANPRARRIAKQFLPEDQYRRLLTQLGPSGGDSPKVSSGKLAETHSRKEGTKMEIAQIGKRIEQKHEHIVSLRDRLVAIDKEIDSDNPTEEQSLEIEMINEEIDKGNKALATLKNIEKGYAIQASTSIPVPAKTAVMPAGNGTALGAPAIVGQFPRKELRPADYVIKAITAMVIAGKYRDEGRVCSGFDIIKEVYNGDQYIEAVLKAAVQPGSTTVAGWASELVQTVTTDFMAALPYRSIFPGLSGMGQKFTFGRNGIIKIPSRSSTPQINGSFVGEGQPIPVRRLGLTSITLTPKKMAVISHWTKELDLHSVPTIEGVVRQEIMVDTAKAIDTALIDTTAADTIRPAGLLAAANVPTSVTASVVVASYDKMVADLKGLIGAIQTAGGGENLALLVNPAQALSLQWVTLPDGSFPFESVSGGNLMGIRVFQSSTVPAAKLIMVDANEFASVTGDTPEFNVSDTATIHEEDTTPLPIGSTGTPAVVAAPVRSLWQTASVGIRMLLPMNWAMRRTAMVAYITAVGW